MNQSDKKLYVAGASMVVVAIGLVVALSAARRSSFAKEAHARVAAVDAGPVVRVTTVSPGGGNRRLELTGESRPFLSVTLYSKVSGYLKDVRVDKGDKVRRGEILATVESPENDAAYASATADALNKRVIAGRDSQLIGQKLIAPEEAETAESDAEQAEAHASAMKTFKEYELLRAPFDGVITGRFADPGALVQNAQDAQAGALPVVSVGTTDSLRIFVYVDQRDAADVQRGTPVTIQDPSRPGAQLTGSITRYTGELDPDTRTLLAEIDVPNHKGLFVPGSIVDVTLDVHAPPYLHVPAAAVFAEGTKNYVAVVTPQNRLMMREVHVVENDGEIVHFMSDSVKTGNRVALDVGNSVPNGSKVQPAAETP
jgi:membrane fusion protein, multidrug efflux system